MRITNRMMTNNMLSNINKNKYNMTALEQQYSTGKKIQRPSDDPIITVRALKLRTNLSELNQYYEKNIPDALSWMDVTESALITVNDVLKQINTYCVQGSSDTLTAADRSSIVHNLKEMKNQIYHEGNANYAGRYVFTGYKTDTSLIFTESNKNLQYEITETFTGEQIQVDSKITGSYELSDYDKDDEGAADYVSFDDPPQLLDIYRLKLSYDKLDNIDLDTISYTAAGSEDPTEVEIDTISAFDDNAYKPQPGRVNFIYETGEIILSKEAYVDMRNAEDIEVNYSKSGFEKGQLRPEHYFNCVMRDISRPDKDDVTFTKDPSGKQEIQYEINYNQKLTINTVASEAISHKIGRDIDDILNSVDDVIRTEEKIAEVKKRMEDKNLTAPDRERYEKLLGQLDTELELKKEIMQGFFENGITSSNKEQDRVNVAVADLGSRYVRLELTENRLSSQKVDFEDLLSKNEDADLVDTIINYNAAQTIYNASLSAASKIVQNSLLDFL